MPSDLIEQLRCSHLNVDRSFTLYRQCKDCGLGWWPDNDINAILRSRAADELARLQREIDEALQLTECASSLKDMAALCIEGAMSKAELARLRVVLTKEARINELLASAAHGWTCFHCGETFTTPGAARDHFGGNLLELAGCQIKAGEERGLLMELRRAQAELERYRADDSDADRLYWVIQADHQVALRREEEKGYARGLEDARRELSQLRVPTDEQVEQACRAYWNEQGAIASWDEHLAMGSTFVALIRNGIRAALLAALSPDLASRQSTVTGEMAAWLEGGMNANEPHSEIAKRVDGWLRALSPEEPTP